MFRWGLGVVACFASTVSGQVDCIYVPPCAQVNYTPVVFVGRVLDRTSYHYRLAVEEIFKGLSQGTEEALVDVTIYGGLEQGRRYLMLARSLGDGPPYVMQCAGEAKPIEKAQDDLNFLREWARGKNVTRLQGRVAENEEDSMVSFVLDEKHQKGLPMAQITATRGRKTYKAISDDKGHFEVGLPRPGDYVVTARLDGHVSNLDEYEITVEPNSCVEQDIGMWIDSSISGRVIDENGRPVKYAPVEAERAGDVDHLVAGSDVTDVNGRYEIRKLPIGEYLVGLNLHGTIWTVSHPPRFYPGVPNREHAVKINVEGAGRIAGRDIVADGWAADPTRFKDKP